MEVGRRCCLERRVGALQLLLKITHSELEMPDLFTPLKLGFFEAKNRIFAAPLTRVRATREAVPTDIMVEYYRQRAASGLIISEATGISKSGLSVPYAPGIFTNEQISQWKQVTNAVHAEGGRMACQLWHMGRAAHSSMTGENPVSASATFNGKHIHTYKGRQPAEQAIPLTHQGIRRVVEDHARAAVRALEAGFDLVQIHGANGYLVDQFLRDSSNMRTDEFGGSIEGRIRFVDLVLEAVCTAVGPERTSVRFSPNTEDFGVVDSNPVSLFCEVSKVVEAHKVAMVELRQSNPHVHELGQTLHQPKVHKEFRQHYTGVLVLNQGFTKQSASEAIENGEADAISFGRSFMTNPDLVAKFGTNAELTEASPEFMKYAYSRGRKGYLDI